MEGIVDVYEEYFTGLTETKVDFSKKNRHICLLC